MLRGDKLSVAECERDFARAVVQRTVENPAKVLR